MILFLRGALLAFLETVGGGPSATSEPEVVALACPVTTSTVVACSVSTSTDVACPVTLTTRIGCEL